MSLQAEQIEREAVEVARKNFGPDKVVRAIVEPMVDLDGEDAWRVTIVIQPDAVSKIHGEAVLGNLVEIHNRLWEKGEQRLPSIEFATEEELGESDDPES
jgi:hypothetical protein